MSLINDEMRKKQEGLTLGEKIAKSLEKIKPKNVIKHISDSFFTPVIENDCHFWVRRTNLFTEDRCRNIDDEVAIQKQVQAELEAIEAARDMTYEEFKFKYEDHIEGKAQNLRTARASNYGESARSKSAKGKKKATSQSAVDDDDDTKSRKSAKADQ